MWLSSEQYTEENGLTIISYLMKHLFYTQPISLTPVEKYIA